MKTVFGAAEDGSIMALLHSDPGAWLEGFKQIVSSSWWRRLWIVQEAVLATHAIVHCGLYTISWARLISALLTVDKETNADPIADSTPNLLKEGGKKAFLCLKLLCSLFREYPIASRGNMDIQYVLSLLSKLSKQGLSDERDRVYGALGMLPPQLRVIPNYGLSTLEVYRDFTKRVISWSRSLDMLRLCDNVSGNVSWPSWTPRLHGLLHSVTLVAHLYGASGEASMFARIKNGKEMFVRAHIVDRIAFAEGFRINDDEDLMGKDVLLERHQAFAKRCYKVAVSPYIPIDSNQLDRSARFWSTLRRQLSVFAVDPIKGVAILHGERALYQELDCWLSGDLRTLSERARSSVRSTQLMSTFMAFAVSDNGYMIHSKEQVPQIGDELALIAGCSEPMIIRPEIEGSRKVYRIVGPCFCQGVPKVPAHACACL